MSGSAGAWASRLLALDPAGLGGIVLRGPAGPARDALLAELQALWPSGAPWRRCPLQVDDARLLGGLDLDQSVAAGRLVAQAGLLAETRGGVLLLPMAERATPALAGRLAQALDAGALALVALDERMADDEPLAPALADRLALVVDTASPTDSNGDAWPAAPPMGALADARRLWGAGCGGDGDAGIACNVHDVHDNHDAADHDHDHDHDAIAALCHCAQALGIEGLRAPFQAWRAACAVAAWRGRTAVTQGDAEVAARLVLVPRARRLPRPTDPTDLQPGDDAAPGVAHGADDAIDANHANGPSAANGPDDRHDSGPPGLPSPARGGAGTGEGLAPHDPSRSGAHGGPMSGDAVAATTGRGSPSPPPPAPTTQGESVSGDRLVAAAQAAMPAGLLAMLAGGVPSARGSASGRQGQANRQAASGRPLPSRRGAPRSGQRLDLLATLRSALPWQALRQRERTRLGLAPSPARWLIRRDDFHARRYRRPAETTTVFVVDASGSQALHRLAEAKGAVELLLADCYVRRDRVALIAFRGTGAQLLLPPTRSLVRAKRALADLPGGGGTPLASGIEAGWRLAAALQAREGTQAQLVFLTDGRGNVDLQGRGGRPAAMADAQQVARRLAMSGLRSLLIDTSVRPQVESALLARQMGARYLALPQGRAHTLHRAVAGLG